MNIEIVRNQRKNADGTYDVLHPETQAKVVWMSDGRSVEEAVGEGGGGGVLVVHCEVSGDLFNGDATITAASHTFNEILAAYEDGKIVVVNTNPIGTTLYLNYVDSTDIYFSCAYPAGDAAIYTIEAKLDPDNNWSIYDAEVSNSGSGDGDIFIVTADIDGTTVTNPSHTFEEILEAYASFKYVVLISNTGVKWELSYFTGSDLVFTRLEAHFSTTVYYLTLNDEGVWSGNRNHLAIAFAENSYPLFASSAGQMPNSSVLRNSKLVSADTTPTVEGEIFWTYG